MPHETYNAYWDDLEDLPFIEYKGKKLYFGMHPYQAEKLNNRMRLKNK